MTRFSRSSRILSRIAKLLQEFMKWRKPTVKQGRRKTITKADPRSSRGSRLTSRWHCTSVFRKRAFTRLQVQTQKRSATFSNQRALRDNLMRESSDHFFVTARGTEHGCSNSAHSWQGCLFSAAMDAACSPSCFLVNGVRRCNRMDDRNYQLEARRAREGLASLPRRI